MSIAQPPDSIVSQRAMLERLLSDGSVRRSAELIAQGVQPQAIADALRAGVITRAAPGAYHATSTAIQPEMLAVAVSCLRTPRAIVCLLSAAYLCNLTDAPPPVTWLALPIGSHAPKKGEGRQQILHWSHPGAFDAGVVQTQLCGVTVRHTSAARTVVDLFRYSRYLAGDEAGTRAAGRFLRRGGDLATLLRIADQVAAPSRTVRALAAALGDLQLPLGQSQ